MNINLSAEDKRRSISERSPGEFDDLISALRTGDVFGDEMMFNKGRKRGAKGRTVNTNNVYTPKKMSTIGSNLDRRDRSVDQTAIAEML